MRQYSTGKTIEEANVEINERWQDAIRTLTHEATLTINGEPSYICPLCNQGARKGKGMTFVPPKKNKPPTTTKTLKCFGCGFTGSVIDLAMQVNGKEYVDTVLSLADSLGIAMAGASQNESGIKAERKPQPLERNPDADDSYGYWSEQQYQEYFQICQRRMKDCQYLTNRGISEELQQRFGIGYDPEWSHPSALMKGYKIRSSRTIIPTGPMSYLARATSADCKKEYKSQKVGSVMIFNLHDALAAGQPIFITEGEIDALSIIEVGGNAIGLGSVSMVTSLLATLRTASDRPKQPFVVCLDSDDAGVNASQKLTEGFSSMHIPYYEKSILLDGTKDPNESLMKDRDAFSERVATVLREVQDDWMSEEDQQKLEYAQRNALNNLPGFMTRVKTRGTHRYTPTGFPNLDKVLDGGLYSGAIYTLGAGTGQGKTSIAHQIADNIAAAGTDVLYYSLEVGQDELIGRSISRNTVAACRAKGLAPTSEGNGYGYGITLHTILTGIPDMMERAARDEQLALDGMTAATLTPAQQQLDVLEYAVKLYERSAEHMFIRYNVSRIGIEEIENEVAEHIAITGNRPIVFVDYLQMLNHPDSRLTDKQKVDAFMFSLKKLAVERNVAVVALSSMNRAAYRDSKGNPQEVNLESFKESGAIEFTSDVVIGMQYKAIRDDAKGFDEDKEASKYQRDMCLRILKNRSGAKGGRIYLKYTAMFYLFEECSEGGEMNLRPVTRGKKGRKDAQPAFTQLPDDTPVPF